MIYWIKHSRNKTRIDHLRRIKLKVIEDFLLPGTVCCTRLRRHVWATSEDRIVRMKKSAEIPVASFIWFRKTWPFKKPNYKTVWRYSPSQGKTIGSRWSWPTETRDYAVHYLKFMISGKKLKISAKEDLNYLYISLFLYPLIFPYLF